MSANSFIFKQFAIDQTNCAMKVGTDGVLLGAWCRLRPEKDEALLDIGTGTGLIALQLAQRTAGWGARIEAVEIDSASAARAEKNFAASKWANRLIINKLSLQAFVAEMSDNALKTSAEVLDNALENEARGGGRRTFDHIVSNPPFFVDSLHAPDPARSAAKHATTLTYEELISLSIKLLTPRSGTISLIVPAGAETKKILKLAAAERLRTTRLTEVHSTPRSGPKRTLIELSRQNAIVQAYTRESQQATQATVQALPRLEKLTIQDADGTFSAEYRALTRDFYLKF